MEFGEQRGAISFEEAERRHAELERRYEAGQIDDEQFDAERQRLLVVDDEGRWWAISREGGRWLYHDDDGSGAWIEATPPAFHRRGIVSQDSPEQFEPPKRAEYDGDLAPHRGAEEARRRQARAAQERYCPGCSAPVGAKSNSCISCGEYLVPQEEEEGAPHLSGTTPGEMPLAPPPGHPPEGDAGRENKAPLLVALGVAGLVMVLPAVAGLLVYFLWPGEAPTMEVPTLEGRTLAAARQEFGEDFELVSTQEESTEQQGTIVSQNPEPGAEALQGEEISVVVSTGIETAMVPYVVGSTRQEAEQALRSAGFEVRAESREGPEGEAGEVVEQSPSGGAAEDGAAVEITVGEAQLPDQATPAEEAGGPTPGYNVIEDPTGALTIEAPPSWGIETGADSEKDVAAPGGWSRVVGYLITSSITVAADLDAWNGRSNQPTTGAYIVVSRELAETYTDDELLYSGPFAGYARICEAGPYEDFDRPPYSGKMQTWFECAGGALTIYMVAAAPEGRECVVLLSLVLPGEGASEAGREAVQHILDTFEADCAGIAGTGGDRTSEVAGADNGDAPPG